MKRKRQWQEGQGPLEMIEETFHLLRLAPAGTLACYAIGSLPFVLGALYFWSDMSRSPFAAERLPAAAWGLSLLFLWMKAWQTVFARALLARRLGAPPPRWTLGQFGRMALVQAGVQGTGLFLLPLAFLLLFPFGWLYAFYQNLTVLGTGGEGTGRAVRKAWRQARLWPFQNHSALLLLKGFGLVVMVNLVSVAAVIPFLLRTLFGIETRFSHVMQNPETFITVFLNSTFFAVIFGLTYLCVDPLLKAYYVLRCFYGESLQTGEDLKAELRQLPARGRATLAAAAAVVLLVSSGLGAARAAEAPAATPATAPPPAAAPVAPQALERSIAEVITEREYSWRLPRAKSAPDARRSGMFAAFFESVWKWVADAMKTVARWPKKLLDWLMNNRRPWEPGGGAGSGWMAALQWVLALLVIVLAVLLVVLVLRLRRPATSEAVAAAVRTAPDVADESVGADQLPEQGWLTLAGELLERGELRLALRAYYFASLAHLAERRMITIARFKSNRDYEREFARRGHALPEAFELFQDNVTVFDRVWYGLHEVNQDVLQHFARNVERLKAAG